MSDCIFANRGGHGHCAGRGQSHHVVPRKTLKGQRSWWASLTPDRRLEVGLPVEMASASKLIADERNLVPLCGRHHDLVTGTRIYVPVSKLPAGIDEFAAEIGLSWWLQEFVYSDHRRTA